MTIRYVTRRAAGGGLVALALVGAGGCGDSPDKGGNPKVASPSPDGKSLPVQTPPPAGGAPAPKGKPVVGSN